jgi:hypothetical protein
VDEIPIITPDTVIQLWIPFLPFTMQVISVHCYMQCISLLLLGMWFGI